MLGACGRPQGETEDACMFWTADDAGGICLWRLAITFTPTFPFSQSQDRLAMVARNRQHSVVSSMVIRLQERYYW